MFRVLNLSLLLVVLSACEQESPVDAFNADAKVIDQLQLAGSDLSKPHPVEFFFYFPTITSAISVCDTLDSQAYTVSAKPSASTDEFVCLATKSMVLTVDEMTQLTSEFEHLATQFGGTYDGWGSPVVE